jgi:hypothetical protein
MDEDMVLPSLIRVIDAAWEEAESEFGWRDNRQEGRGYEVYRHADPEVVSPVVLSRHGWIDEAERALRQAQCRHIAEAVLRASK